MPGWVLCYCSSSPVKEENSRLSPLCPLIRGPGRLPLRLSFVERRAPTPLLTACRRGHEARGRGGARSAVRRRGDVFIGACRPGGRRGGLQVHSPASWRCVPRRGGLQVHSPASWRSVVRRRGDVFIGANRRGRRRGGLQLYQLRAAWGDTGQLSGIWLGLCASASGGAAQSASMFICTTRGGRAAAMKTQRKRSPQSDCQ